MDRRPLVACLGESMLVLTPPAGDTLADCPVAELHVAGAEGNVACGLAHLGVRVEWLSRLGEDPLAERVRAFLGGRGVGVAHVPTDPVRPTGLMLKDRSDGGSGSVHYYRAGSAASALDRGVLPMLQRLAPDLLHLSGITAALSASTYDLMEALVVERAAPGLVSLDVNHRPALWSAAEAAEPLRRLADAADVVLVGLDEAERLWGCRTPEEVRDTLPHPGTVVVKDGPVAAWELGEHTSRVPALRVDVVDVVGAGDAFAAGWLAGLLGGHPPEARLRLGHLMAASTITSTADAPTLPDAATLWRRATDDLWEDQ